MRSPSPPLTEVVIEALVESTHPRKTVKLDSKLLCGRNAGFTVFGTECMSVSYSCRRRSTALALSLSL